MRVFSRKTKSGRVWYAEWSAGKDAEGKYRYHRKGGFRTKAEAQHYLADAVGNPSVPPNRFTVGIYTELWLEEYASRLEPRTFEYYEGQARRYILPDLGRVKLRELSPAVIRSFYNKLRLRPRPLSEATILKVHRQLLLVFKHAVRDNLLAQNPVDFVEAPKVRRSEAPVYHEDQVNEYLAAAKGTPIQGLLTLAAYTGLSRGEVLGLQWQDLDGSLLSVRRARKIVNREEVVGPTKRLRRNRTVYLPEEVLEALPLRGLPQAWIFDLSWHQVTHWLRVVSKRAGVKGARMHVLRHAFASIAIDQGAPLTAVSEVLGHADAAITARVYSHALKGHQEETGKRVAAALKRAQ